MLNTNQASSLQIDDRWMLSKRGVKNPVTPWQPYALLLEKERTATGQIENTAAVFLSNRECPFRCLMCDLWQNTTDHRVPDGAIPAQIRWALERLQGVAHIKLYNSGNFFDEQAIPPADIPEIAKMLNSFKTVIVECHPRLIDERCLYFRDLLQPQLQVALGLETAHPEVLQKLNKRMTLEDFANAACYLAQNDILVRAFILLKPPFLDENEGVMWAKRSIDFAFAAGAECCVIIPTRTGNGALESLLQLGLFSPPKIESLEEVLEFGIELQQGRTFADLWNVEQFSNCNQCSEKRKQRMLRMNLTQRIAPPLHCSCA